MRVRILTATALNIGFENATFYAEPPGFSRSVTAVGSSLEGNKVQIPLELELCSNVPLNVPLLTRPRLSPACDRTLCFKTLGRSSGSTITR